MTCVNISVHRESDTVLLSTSSATIAVLHYDNNSRSYCVTVSARNRAVAARRYCYAVRSAIVIIMSSVCLSIWKEITALAQIYFMIYCFVIVLASILSLVYIDCSVHSVFIICNVTC